MTATASFIRPSFRCLRCAIQRNPRILHSRQTLTSITSSGDETSLQDTPSTLTILDPMLVSTRKEEEQLLKTGVHPIGSRRRRAALQGAESSIPFEQLPYQCFQEARKILQADREEKLKQIEQERKRIAKVQAKDAGLGSGEASKKGRLIAMHKHLEHLKILADINDPVIKKRFEDGEGLKLSTTPTDTIIHC